ncbi:MAG: hypothetical protein ACI39R_02740 [Lachnospiraceae bacterium]
MTRIFVIKRKYLLTALIALITILALIAVLIIKSRNKEPVKETVSNTYGSSSEYIPGLYTGQLALGDYNTTLEVLVDDTQVKNVRIINSDEAVETMYPLVGTTIADINNMLRSGTSIEELLNDIHNGYTYSLLTNEINSILDKAKIN